MLQNLGSRLATFTTSNAARDLNRAIQTVKAEGGLAATQDVWIGGYSYGTYLLNRFLTLFPTVATGTFIHRTVISPPAT